MLVDVIQIRQIGARRSEGRANPVTETAAVSGKVNVMSTEFEFHQFPYELHAVAVRLQESDIRMAIYSKLRLRVLDGECLQLDTWNPGCGDDDVFCRCMPKAITKVIGVQDGPNVRLDTFTTQDLGGINGSDSQADVANVAVRCEILICED